MQGLLDNPRGKSAKDLLSKCKQQVPSDNMVSFLRAITAKGFMDKGEGICSGSKTTQNAQGEHVQGCSISQHPSVIVQVFC